VAGARIVFGAVPAFVAEGDGPGVVVVHDWWGLVPQIERVCERLAAAGYTALAPDLYRGAWAANDDPDEADRLMTALDREGAVADAVAAVAELRRRGCATVGIIGFCTGGAVSLAASAVCSVEATVSYYGIWPHHGEREITNPVLVHVAEHEDYNPLVTPAQFPRWFTGMTNVQLHVYPGTQHAFFNEARPDLYDAAAATLSWDRTLQFLAQHLHERSP
jgi:carboxymethylenebutenolidase